VWVVKAAAQHF